MILGEKDSKRRHKNYYREKIYKLVYIKLRTSVYQKALLRELKRPAIEGKEVSEVHKINKGLIS